MPHKGDSEEVPAQSSSHLAKTKPCRQLSLASHTASQEPLDRPHVVLHMGIASHSAFRERESSPTGASLDASPRPWDKGLSGR
jgi:hypothetical protein